MNPPLNEFRQPILSFIVNDDSDIIYENGIVARNIWSILKTHVIKLGLCNCERGAINFVNN